MRALARRARSARSGRRRRRGCPLRHQRRPHAARPSGPRPSSRRWRATRRAARHARCCCREPTSRARSLAEQLREAGADVTEVVAYRTIAAEPQREGDPDIYGHAARSARSTPSRSPAPSAIRNFVEMLGADQAADLLQHDRGRDDWPGDGGGGAAARHHADRHAVDVHRSRRSSTRWSRTSQREHEPRLALRSAVEHQHRVGLAPTSTRRAAAAAPHARRSARSVRETRLSPDMFIHPLFVCEGERRAPRSRVDAGRVPAVGRRGGRAKPAAAKADGVPGVLLFGLPERKDDDRQSAPTIPRRRSRPPCARSSAKCPALLVDHRRLPVRVHRRTATAASSTARRSSTTPPSSSWCAPRSRTPRPAPTSSRRPT